MRKKIIIFSILIIGGLCYLFLGKNSVESIYKEVAIGQSEQEVLNNMGESFNKNIMGDKSSYVWVSESEIELTNSFPFYARRIEKVFIINFENKKVISKEETDDLGRLLF